LPVKSGDRSGSQEWRSPYPWWDFAREGIKGLLIQRIVLRTDGGSRLQTELYAAEDGRLLRTFPESGPGRLLQMSEDRRFPVVLAGVRHRGRLGTLANSSRQRRLPGVGAEGGIRCSRRPRPLRTGHRPGKGKEGRRARRGRSSG